MFSLNLAAWIEDPVVAARAGPGELTGLQDRLRGRSHDPGDDVVVWTMRQVVWATAARGAAGTRQRPE